MINKDVALLCEIKLVPVQSSEDRDANYHAMTKLLQRKYILKYKRNG